MHHRTVATILIAGTVAVAACADETTAPGPAVPVEVAYSQVVSGTRDLSLRGGSLDEINQKLAEAGANIAVAKAEYVLAANASGPLVEQANHTVFANDRQLRLDSRWVPGDLRRGADGNNITFLNFEPLMPANWGTPTELDGEGAIDASFDTWNAVQCTGLNLVKRPDTGVFPSAIFVGGNPFVADIVTLGFIEGFWFDVLFGPGGSQNILGVTFTVVFINPDGSPTDIDNDGRTDTALKEVWYNDAFEWTTVPGQPAGATDIETVALHENGHALELGHFGKIHATFNNGRGNTRPGRLHVSPRAVMNAFILGTLRDPLGTDNAAYCSNFGSWPR